MTEKIQRLLENLKKGEYKQARGAGLREEELKALGQTKAFEALASLEKPVFFHEDSMGFNRYTNCFSLKSNGNITPDYEYVLNRGIDCLYDEISQSINKTEDEEKKSYGAEMKRCTDIALSLAKKYKDGAKDKNEKLYNALLKVPHKPAESFYEACVFLKFIIYTLRLYGTTHLTLGRFDQYMYPFYLNSKNSGVSNEELFETLEEFFISVNYDIDLYHGVQQGDDGQSMVLAGFDKEGKYLYNELSQMCMEASLELCLIDPKINLRVGKNTPDEIYEMGTQLTKKGLGFPQYLNDDIVVPGLKKLGYKEEHAIDYSVAACWEYIVPKYGGDIPNISLLDFPWFVNKAIKENLLSCQSFDELMECVKNEIEKACDDIIERLMERREPDMPYLSVFMRNCRQNLKDIWKGGAVYNNYGCHGVGIANATDALAAVRKTVYDDKSVKKQELLDALTADFKGHEEVRNLLKAAPKMGDNEDYADSIADVLMDAFSEHMNNRPNGVGGIWRAGTGSAMEYVRRGEVCPATADGRRNFEPYSSSFSPSLDVKISNLLSVIQSFTKHDMTEIINGGPLTIEIHDTVLRNDEGIKKVALLVKNYILLGGHELQLNSVNRERMLDAKAHPEKYPNLIVRVWGWSGYFNELDVKYQDHIIGRLEYTE